ncbi:YjdF family protein [Leptotrichia hongkongensis]|uniref:YjdF family protein n=1 Tax=Leptotrichia hongkongensis TaxID=554406 RepID=UPI0035A8B719
MRKISGKLTVFFENPFWVGIFENFENSNLSVCKVTFGSEPKEYEIYDFILKKFYNLRFSDEMKLNFNEKAKNPKRRQREIKKELQSKKILKKSEEILKLQYEENKKEQKVKKKQEKELEKQKKFLLKQEKKKKKHKGR